MIVKPRETWGRLSLHPPADVGYARAADGRLLFEGDRERWDVPAGVVVAAAAEEPSMTGAESGPLSMSRAFAVLRVALPDGGERELCLEPRDVREDADARSEAARALVRTP